MKHMRRILMIAGIILLGAAAVYMVQRYQAQQEAVKVQGFNGIGIGGGNFALGLGETDNGKPVIGIPWGNGRSEDENSDENSDENN